MSDDLKANDKLDARDDRRSVRWPLVAAGRFVLIVEDDALIALGIETILTAIGVRSVVARTLSSAKFLLETQDFTFAVVDHGPDDGPIRYLSEILSGQGVPFAICSGYAHAGLTAQSLGVPIVWKPFSEEDLATVVLTGHKHGSSSALQMRCRADLSESDHQL